jgi:hypothetical protein
MEITVNKTSACGFTLLHLEDGWCGQAFGLVAAPNSANDFFLYGVAKHAISLPKFNSLSLFFTLLLA